MLAREAALRERKDDLANLRNTVTALQKTLSDRAIEIEHLGLWIAKLQRMQFGRKSEKMDCQIEQAELRCEDRQVDGRKPLPGHLMRREGGCAAACRVPGCLRTYWLVNSENTFSSRQSVILASHGVELRRSTTRSASAVH